MYQIIARLGKADEVIGESKIVSGIYYPGIDRISIFPDLLVIESLNIFYFIQLRWVPECVTLHDPIFIISEITVQVVEKQF